MNRKMLCDVAGQVIFIVVNPNLTYILPMEDEPRRGPESANAHKRRVRDGFYQRFMQGKGIDIGYKGNPPVFEPVLRETIGVDLDTPGYDGIHLPFEDESLDYVYASHTLEHISDYVTALQEWFRPVKVGGYLIICVPHVFLYEKKWTLPSRYNADHKRFYTPGNLLLEVENSLYPNTYRLRWLQDCDEGFDYTIPPETHSHPEYQIECVIQKIKRPGWELTE